MRYLRPQSKLVALYMFMFIIRTARMLVREDRVADARRVLDIGRSTIPGLFAMQDVRKTLASFGQTAGRFDKRPSGHGQPLVPYRRTQEVIAALEEQGRLRERGPSGFQ